MHNRRGSNRRVNEHWVSGHRGVRGQKAADALAKVEGSFSLDPAERLLMPVSYDVRKVDSEIIDHVKIR